MNTNDDFINCWNEILVPKWNRFRHLLSGNGVICKEPGALMKQHLRDNGVYMPSSTWAIRQETTRACL